MTDIWQPGDLALCIKQGIWRMVPTGEEIDTGPRAGQIVPVLYVGRARVIELGPRVLLGFKEWPRDQFVADNFVKMDLQQSHEVDEETDLLLKRQSAEAADIAIGVEEADEARAWQQSLGQARSNVLQSLVRARDSRGEFATREDFHRAMLEARNFKAGALEWALRKAMDRDRHGG